MTMPEYTLTEQADWANEAISRWMTRADAYRGPGEYGLVAFYAFDEVELLSLRIALYAVDAVFSIDDAPPVPADFEPYLRALEGLRVAVDGSLRTIYGHDDIEESPPDEATA